LSADLPTWRKLLPETRSPADVSDLESGQWVIKPALGHEGYNVRIREVAPAEEWRQIVRSVRKRPYYWAAQKRFEPIPLSTPEGFLNPCLGVYVVDGQVAGCYGRMATGPLIDEQSREICVLVCTG